MVRAIYEAAVQPDGWPTVLEGLRRSFGGSTSALLTWDQRTNTSRVMSSRTEPAGEYVRHWNSRNPLRLQFPSGFVGDDSTMMDRRDLRRTSYYNEFLAPHDLHQLLVLKLWNNGREDAAINLFRTARQRDFDATDLGTARRLLPHLQAATQLASRLAGTSVGQHGDAAVLDRLSVATMLLDQNGAVLHANAAAQRLGAAADGLTFGQAGITATAAEDRPRLALIVGRAVRGDAEHVRHAAALAIARPSRRRPYAVLVAPLSMDAVWMLPRRAAAIVTVVDPDSAPRMPAGVLRALYGLTRSEAAVALGIAGGAELGEVAARLGLTAASARQYLSRAFAKTGTARQHELTRLLTIIAQAPIADH
jgi:DNA-binding CsgD family transcriptional regulator